MGVSLNSPPFLLSLYSNKNKTEMNRQQRRKETRDIEKELKSYSINRELKALSNDKELLETTAYTIDKDTNKINYVHEDDMKLLNENKHTNDKLQKKFNRLLEYYSRIRALESRLQYLIIGYKEDVKEPIPAEGT
jgi:cupin superfamily acireductone dioxygenase involved in methionine salvage